MDLERLETHLEGIRHLLSHLHNEVTSLEESYHQVHEFLRKVSGLALHDDLTGVLRRQPFFTRWEAVLSECEKLKTNCGLVLLDLDHFKMLNDSHGHQAGDEALQRVSSMLRRFESPQCFVGRYGGEEFVISFCGTERQIEELAERIRCEAETLEFSLSDWKCTLSAGTASARKEGYEASRLLKAADEALYRAKKAGRNKIEAA